VKTYPFTLIIPKLSRTMWESPNTPFVVIFDSSMESFDSWVDSTPQEPKTPNPHQFLNPFSPKVLFNSFFDLLAPLIDLKFLWCIALSGVQKLIPSISLSFPDYINQIHNIQFACENWMFWFWQNNPIL
jgi:hypothetical protein